MHNELMQGDFLATAAIGQDFEAYGGDVVMLIAARERALEEALRARSLSSSTRARVRASVNLSLVEMRFAGLFENVRDGYERIRPLEKACRAMRAARGRYWLADTLADYYTEIQPVDDPVSTVSALVDRAARVIATYEDATD